MIQITEDDCNYVGIRKRQWKDTDIQSLNPFDDCNKDRFSLSAHFVNITCGPYNQDCMINMAGKKGSGKSYSSIELARLCAIRTAIALDNDESKWPDYFDIERNVAIMDADKMIDILTSSDKHQVIISDDSGTIQGARKYHSDENQLMNDVFVVMRTNNNIYFSSAPESKHVDRQARDLPEHQLDFLKNEAGLKQGWTIAKYFQKITDPKTSESQYHYHWWNNMKAVRCIIQKPPKKLTDEYDKLREIGKRKKQEALKRLKEEREKEKENAGEIVSTGHRRQTEKAIQRAQKARQEVDNLVTTTGCTEKEALFELKIPIRTWQSWKYQRYI